MKIRKRRWHLVIMRQRPPDSLIINLIKFITFFYYSQMINLFILILLLFQNVYILSLNAIILSGAPDSFARFF